MDRMKGILGEEMSPAVHSVEYDRDANPIRRKGPTFEKGTTTSVEVGEGGACGGEERGADKADKACGGVRKNLDEKMIGRPGCDWRGFYSGKSLDELLGFASLIREDRLGLYLVAELIPIKLMKETNGGKNAVLDPVRIHHFKKLLDRILSEKDDDCRLICLMIVRDFLAAYEEEFIKLCHPQYCIAEIVEELLHKHHKRPQICSYELEFDVLMEISEWVERCLGVVAWLKPQYKKIKEVQELAPPPPPHQTYEAQVEDEEENGGEAPKQE